MMKPRNKATISQAVVRRALLSKQFYGHAVEHSLRTSPIDRMIAVHNFHLSIEILLRAIANEYGVKNYGFLSFSKLLEGINKSEKAIEKGLTLPYLQGINELTKWRNMAQHGSTGPDPVQIEEWRALTYLFLREVAKSYLSVDFDKISSIDLVANEEFRQLLRKVQDGIHTLINASMDDEGNPMDYLYQLSATILGIVFAFSFGTARWYLPHPVIGQLVDIPEMVRSFEDDPIAGLLWKRVREIEISNLFQLLGIDYWIYQELVEIMPLVVLDKELSPWLGLKSDVDPDVLRLQRIQDHLVNVLVSWESKGWLPESVGLGDDPYSVAIDYILEGKELKTFQMEDEKPKSVIEYELGHVIREGYPGFMQGEDYWQGMPNFDHLETD